MNTLTQHGPYIALPLALLRQVGPDLAAVTCYVVNQVQLAGGPVAISLEAMTRDLKIPERSLRRLFVQFGQIGLIATRTGFPPRLVFSVDFDVLNGFLSNSAKMAETAIPNSAKMAGMEPQFGQNGRNEAEPSETQIPTRAKIAVNGKARGIRIPSNSAKMAELQTPQIAGPEPRPARGPSEAERPTVYINGSLKETTLKEKEKELGGVSIGDLLIGPEVSGLDHTPKDRVTIPEFYAQGNQRMAGQVAEDTLTSMGLGALLVNLKKASQVGHNQWHAWLSQVIMPHRERLGAQFQVAMKDAILEALSKPPRFMLQDVVKVLAGTMPLQRSRIALESIDRPGSVLDSTPEPRSEILAHIDAWLDTLPPPPNKRSN